MATELNKNYETVFVELIDDFLYIDKNGDRVWFYKGVQFKWNARSKPLTKDCNSCGGGIDLDLMFYHVDRFAFCKEKIMADRTSIVIPANILVEIGLERLNPDALNMLDSDIFARKYFNSHIPAFLREGKNGNYFWNQTPTGPSPTEHTEVPTTKVAKKKSGCTSCKKK